jgi:Tol biopolymer transport system component
MIRPTSTFKARGRAQLMAHMKARPRNRFGRWWATVSPFQFPAFSRAANVALGLAAILFLSLTTGTVLAQRSLPGDTLYEWKIATEEFVQAVYPDSLTIDLFVSERRNQDLARVVSNPDARQVALQEYQEILKDLSAHTAPQAKEKITEALVKQQANLAQAQVVVPELDRLLETVEETPPPVANIPREAELQLDYQATTVSPGMITYEITVANSGPFAPATAKLTSRLSPAETLVSADESRCTVSGNGEVTCTLDQLQKGEPLNLTLTTKVDPCYSGMVEHTATLEGAAGLTNLNPEQQVVARTDFTAPFPRSAQIAYVQSNERRHDLGLVASTANPLNLELHVHAAAPAWSPDGTRLAFFGEEGISESGGIYTSGNGLWVINVTGTQGQNPRLLSKLDHIKNIAWSPDGLKIAVEVGPPDLPHEIYIVNAQNGHEISRFPGEQPAWSPNSQRLVIKSCEPGCGLWLVNTQGKVQQQVTTNGTDSYPVWSPDGQYLAFSSSDRDNNWEIYLLDWTNDQITRLTHRQGTDTTPVFGPCSQEIYLRTDQYGGWWITAMKLDGSDEYKVQEGVGSTPDWGLARPAIR